jgi:hypothetical protein
MATLKTSAPADDENEITAELPVLDVAAYESSLAEAGARTDSWAAPMAADATAQMPQMQAPDTALLPTLQPAADLENTADHAATMELPVPAPTAATGNRNKILKATPIVVPPSPPLIEDLRQSLAAAERRIEELNERARIADVERVAALARVNAECAQLREQLGQVMESRHTERARRGLREVEQDGMVDELFARADRIAALERELAARDQALGGVQAALEAAHQRIATLEVEAANQRAASSRRDTRIAMLEADLAARQVREQTLQRQLVEARAAADPHAAGLREQLVARDEEIGALKLKLADVEQQSAERIADLEVAEESIRNLEIELRDKSGKLEEASVTVEEWRAVIAETQRSILQRDTRIRELEADLHKRVVATPDQAAATGEEVALEGPARLLIRTDGNTDYVHVLGRRTRIGRGADNELVIDTKHVSRYHAVLLAGPVHTSIEDLRSTNGVFVNGKRVTRQTLKDGDRVTVGRTQFRFTIRD